MGKVRVRRCGSAGGAEPGGQEAWPRGPNVGTFFFGVGEVEKRDQCT